jgi:hypothetical protein
VAGIYEIHHKGKTIFCVDVAGLRVPNKAEFSELIAKAKMHIAQQPSKSLLILTNVSNTGFDTEIAAIMGEYAEHNTPFIKASALVGVSGVQKVVLAAIKALTGRDFYLADTVEEAQEWLVQQ